MPLTDRELELKKLAVERIQCGLLPAEVPKQIWAGNGRGEPCSLCDQSIAGSEMEYELAAAALDGTNLTVRFHIRCHALWQLELARRTSEPTGMSSCCTPSSGSCRWIFVPASFGGHYRGSQKLQNRSEGHGRCPPLSFALSSTSLSGVNCV
jgi:hypothetical protein